MRHLAAVLAVVVVGGAAALALAQPAPSAPAAPLIAREVFFGNPSRVQGRLSPDGKQLAWLAPRDGVMNVWVAPAGDMAKARPVTNEKLRPIRQYFWSPDSSMVLFVNDKNGDEDFLLYGVDLATGAEKLLTPFTKTRVQLVGVSRRIKDRILVGLNNRDPRWHDLYSLDLKTGALTLVLRNDGYGGFVADDGLEPRIARKPLPTGGVELYRITGGKVEATPFDSIPFEDAQTTSPVGFTADGKTLYWIDSRGRDTSALIAQDMATGAKTVLANDPRADIAGGMANPRTGRIEAYAVNYLKTEWTAMAPAVKADLAFLKTRLKGELGVSSRTDADDRWLVGVDPVTGPSAVYLYDRKARVLTQLYLTRPDLQGKTLAAMKPVEIRSRDGLTLVSYLTLPPGSDPDGDGKPDRPVPMALYVHGGPWGRDGYGFNGVHQWLANRGYAVLSVNFRASTGFGKAFMAAGDKQWGAKMHDDLIDAVDWAVARGVTRPDTVAIMGGSYGGYATLAALTVTPDKFACGVDIVGPSNLNTLLKATPAYWESEKAQMYRRMGDPNTPEGQALLKARSPLFMADRIKRPLLIGQGANDPRVNRAESDSIVKAMQAKGIPVSYVVFPDEGHGFAKPQNSIAFFAVAEQFLSGCLGGRVEPYGPSLRASSIQIEAEAPFTPGLKAARGG